MTTAKYPAKSRDEELAEMKAAARKMWDEADAEVSPHLANAIRRVAQVSDSRIA